MLISERAFTMNDKKVGYLKQTAHQHWRHKSFGQGRRHGLTPKSFLPSRLITVQHSATVFHTVCADVGGPKNSPDPLGYGLYLETHLSSYVQQRWLQSPWSHKSKGVPKKSRTLEPHPLTAWRGWRLETRCSPRVTARPHMWNTNSVI